MPHRNALSLNALNVLSVTTIRHIFVFYSFDKLEVKGKFHPEKYSFSPQLSLTEPPNKLRWNFQHIHIILEA